MKEKLGPVLWQFPPNFAFDPERFETFFQLLPRDSKSAAQLARHHDAKLKGRALTRADTNRPIRHAVEIRHESFRNAEFIALLRKHGVALVIADTAGRWPFGEDVTADFIYARLHGAEELYASGYTPEALDAWAGRLKAWRGGKQPADANLWSDRKPAKAKHRDVFVYFDNDVKVKAPFDAMGLADRLGEAARGAARTDRAEVAPTEIARLLSERVRSHWPGVRKAKSG